MAALVESIDAPVHLLGHSFGGLCSLEAALRTDALGRLILYEPVILDAPTGEEQALVAIGQAVEAGRREEALVTFYRQLAHLTEAEIDYIRSQPTWQRRVDAVHTCVREAEAGFDYEFEPARFREMTTPTLLLVGSESPPIRPTGHRNAGGCAPGVPNRRPGGPAPRRLSDGTGTVR